MADLYADEQFPIESVRHLRTLGHNVLTVQDAGNANQGIPDEEVLSFAIQQERAVLTINRRDFIRLHKQSTRHAGIVVVKDDQNKIELAERINRVIKHETSLTGKLVRVKKMD